MKVGSLFSGIGGIDLAFEHAGFHCAWKVEWDPAARSILRRHWPNVPLHSDIIDVDPAGLESVDVITFGSPCQDLSVAGKRAGLGGKQSGLFFEAIRIIQGVRPRFALWENVPGVFSSNGGRDFAAVLAAFRECGAREFGWRVLDAQYFGVAQRRRRVFLVADFGGECASEILFERQGVSGNPPTRREAGALAPTLAASGAGTGRTGNERTEADFLVTEALPMECEAPEVAGTLGAITGGQRQDLDGMTYVPVAYALRADPGVVGQGHNTNYIVDDVAHTVTAQYASHGGKSAGNNPGLHNAVIEVAHTLTAGTSNGEGVNPPGRRHEDDYNLVTHTLRGEGFDGSEDGTGRGTPLVADSLTTKPWADNKGQESRLVTQNMAVRRLTPMECERLQGLLDDWTRWGADGKELSDSARYRLIGNAVAVPVVEWIAKRMAMTLEGAQ